MSGEASVAGQAPAAPAATEGQPGGTPAATTEAPTPSPSASSQPASEQMFEIKVGGQAMKLTREEVIARAQMGEDYTRSKQKLADERRTWESDRQAVLRQERERWAREQQEAARRQQQQELDPGTQALQETRLIQQRSEERRVGKECRL